MPVEPGKIKEYVLRLYPFAAMFQPGHRLVVLSNDEPLADAYQAARQRGTVAQEIPVNHSPRFGNWVA
ncbi:hypothetical protein ACF09J_28645 [Streptomyces sp. NPDC014889]|uniref:hypothetical protein n=1 Tax=Streptomyces sp. NPDC014889 TaxID=3364928 RepID=UPI0036FE53EC